MIWNVIIGWLAFNLAFAVMRLWIGYWRYENNIIRLKRKNS